MKPAKKRPRGDKGHLAIIFVGNLGHYNIKKENRDKIIESIKKVHSLNGYIVSGAWLDTTIRTIEQWRLKIEMNIVNSEAKNCVAVYLGFPADNMKQALGEYITSIRDILGTKLKYEVGFNTLPNDQCLQKLKDQGVSPDGHNRFEGMVNLRGQLATVFAQKIIPSYDVYSIQLDPFAGVEAEKGKEIYFDLFAKQMAHLMKPFASLPTLKKQPSEPAEDEDDDAFDGPLRPSKSFKKSEEERKKNEAMDQEENVDTKRRERSDAIIDKLNVFLDTNTSATAELSAAASKMAQSGAYMANAAASLPKEFHSYTQNNTQNNLNVNGQPPPKSKPSKEVRGLLATNGMQGSLLEKGSRGEAGSSNVLAKYK